MNNSTLPYDLKTSSDNISPEIIDNIHHALKHVARKDPVATQLITLNKPEINQTKQPINVLVHSIDVPTPGWSPVKYSPEDHKIHIYTSKLPSEPHILQKQLADAFTRGAYGNLLKHVTSGKDELVKQIPPLTSSSPLSSKERRDKLINKVKYKAAHLALIKSQLKDIQNSAYDEVDSHGGRYAKGLKRFQKKHSAGTHSPGINNIIIAHLKNRGSRILTRRMKAKNTAELVSKLYKHLQDKFLPTYTK